MQYIWYNDELRLFDRVTDHIVQIGNDLVNIDELPDVYYASVEEFKDRLSCPLLK